uniref:Uncharacterized protein n=1 Tax=Arundo donax TaxID=35708 RepID=A0A0A9FR56_ARUDO
MYCLMLIQAANSVM